MGDNEHVTTDPIRVVIIDDQAPFRDAARLVVELADGFDVVAEADSGEAGVAAVAEHLPDLVLVDLAMPGIDGMETTRRIRALPHPARIVLMLSTYDPDEHRDRALAAGAYDFVAKGEFTPELLEQVWNAATAV